MTIVSSVSLSAYMVKARLVAKRYGSVDSVIFTLKEPLEQVKNVVEPGFNGLLLLECVTPYRA